MAKTILIIDDEIELRDLVADFLVFEGYHCHTASSLKEALMVLVQKDGKLLDFDLIISDFHMPGGSGLDLLIAIREKNIKTPIFFLSGDNLDQELKLKLDYGVVGFQMKPFDSDQLIQKVKELLPNK